MMLMENRVAKAFKENKKSYGLYLHSPCKKFIEMMAAARMDFVRLDLEGGIYDMETLGKMILFSRAVGLTPFVRIDTIDPVLIKRVINMGAMGITLPHVKSYKDAELVVKAAKCPPLGSYRSVSSPFADYGLAENEYEEWSKENIIVGVQIERREAVEDLDNILKVEGLDMICSGRGSLSESYGYSSQYDPFILDIERQTMGKALAAGKITSVCYSVYSMPDLYEYVNEFGNMGVSSFALGGDTAISGVLHDTVKHCNNLIAR